MNNKKEPQHTVPLCHFCGATLVGGEIRETVGNQVKRVWHCPTPDKGDSHPSYTFRWETKPQEEDK